MRVTFLFIALFTIQCTLPTPKTKSVDTYFDLISLTQELIQHESQKVSSISKTNIVNGKKEESIIKITDSLFWATELTPLLNSDINKPSLLDAYLIESEIKEQNSNLLKTVYTIKAESKSKVKRIEIKYLEHLSEIRQIYAELVTDNPVYVTHQSIQIWLNNENGNLRIDSLITQGFNKTIFLDSMVYSSSIKTK